MAENHADQQGVFGASKKGPSTHVSLSGDSCFGFLDKGGSPVGGCRVRAAAKEEVAQDQGDRDDHGDTLDRSSSPFDGRRVKLIKLACVEPGSGCLKPVKEKLPNTTHKGSDAAARLSPFPFPPVFRTLSLLCLMVQPPVLFVALVILVSFARGTQPQPFRKVAHVEFKDALLSFPSCRLHRRDGFVAVGTSCSSPSFLGGERREEAEWEEGSASGPTRVPPGPVEREAARPAARLAVRGRLADPLECSRRIRPVRRP